MNEFVGNTVANQDAYAFYMQGCYEDDVTTPDLTGQSVTSSSMKLSDCQTQCAESKYMGLKVKHAQSTQNKCLPDSYPPLDVSMFYPSPEVDG